MKVHLHLTRYLLRSLRTERAFRGPRTARVQDVPSRTHALVPAASGIVVSETVYEVVPDGGEVGDQERFSKGDPDIVHYEESAVEVGDIEVGRGDNAFGVFLQAGEQRLSRGGALVSALPGASGDRLAYVDRDNKFPPGVFIGQGGIRLKRPGVIDGVYSRPRKIRDASQRVRLS